MDVQPPLASAQGPRPHTCDLPPELWIATMDAIRGEQELLVKRLLPTPPPHIKTLKSLARVSKTFLTLAEPFLYEEVKIDSKTSDKTEALLAHIKQDPERLNWIKVIRLDNWDFTTTYDDASTPRTWKILMDAVLQMKNLSAVRLTHMTISSDLCVHLLRLPKMVTFSSYGLRVKGSWPADLKSTQLNVRTVIYRLAYLSTRSPRRQESKAHLQYTLGPSVERIVHGTSFAPFVFSLMKEKSVDGVYFSRLTEYHIAEATWTTLKGLFEIAHHLPNITSLVLGWSTKARTPTDDEFDVVPYGPFPLLERLSVPFWLVPRLMSGCSVNDLTIIEVSSDASTNARLFRRIGSSGSTVASIGLQLKSLESASFEEMAQTFPSLEHLSCKLSETLEPQEVRIAS